MRWISPRELTQKGLLSMNRRNVDYISRYNPRAAYPLVDNKVKTKLLALEYEIRTPKLLQLVNQQHEIQHFRELVGSLSGFAIKPAKGSGGKGITVITDKVDGQFVKASGAVVDVATLERHLTNILAGLYSLGGAEDIAIVESLIKPCPLLAKYSYQGVPDIRIIIFQGYPVMAMLRLATTTSDGKANLHQGAVGVGISIADGTSLNAVQFNRPIELHPDTGLSLSTIALDNWKEMLIMAAKSYEATGLGYIGVDLVIDEHQGPMLLELNARPGLAIQIANGRGLLPRLKMIEALKRHHPTAEGRVEFSMNAFGS